MGQNSLQSRRHLRRFRGARRIMKRRSHSTRTSTTSVLSRGTCPSTTLRPIRLRLRRYRYASRLERPLNAGHLQYSIPLLYSNLLQLVYRDLVHYLKFLDASQGGLFYCKETVSSRISECEQFTSANRRVRRGSIISDRRKERINIVWSGVRERVGWDLLGWNV